MAQSSQASGSSPAKYATTGVARAAAGLPGSVPCCTPAWVKLSKPQVSLLLAGPHSHPWYMKRVPQAQLHDLLRGTQPVQVAHPSPLLPAGAHSRPHPMVQIHWSHHACSFHQNSAGAGLTPLTAAACRQAQPCPSMHDRRGRTRAEQSAGYLLMPAGMHGDPGCMVRAPRPDSHVQQGAGLSWNRSKPTVTDHRHAQPPRPRGACAPTRRPWLQLRQTPGSCPATLPAPAGPWPPPWSGGACSSPTGA